MSGLNIALVIKALDQASGPISAIVGRLGELHGRVGQLQAAGAAMAGFGAATIAAGASIAAALAAPLAAFRELEAARVDAEIAFLSQGNQVDPLFQQIAAQAEELGNKLPGTSADFLRLAQSLKSAGMSSQAILGGGLTAAANLKTLLGGSMSYAALGSMVANFGDALGLMESDFNDLADLVQRSNFAFGLDPTSFNYAIKYVGSAATTLGLGGLDGAKQLAPLIGMLQQVGISGETAGTALRSIFSTAASWREKMTESKDIQSMLPDLRRAGIDLNQFQLFDKSGEFLGLDHMYEQLAELQKLAPETRMRFLKAMFGEEAAGVAAKLSERGLDGVNLAKEALLNQGSMADRLGRRVQTLDVIWDSAAGTATNLAAAIGAALAPAAKGFLITVNDWLSRGITWVQANQQIVATLGLVAGAIAATLVGIGAIAVVIGGATMALGQLRMAFGVAAAAARLLGLALTLNPIGLIATGIAAAAVLIIANWDLVTAAFDGFLFGFQAGWAAIQPSLAALAAAFAPIQAAAQPVLDWLGAALTSVAEFFGLTGARSTEAGIEAAGFGMAVGRGVATAIGWLAQAMTFVVNLQTTFWQLPAAVAAALGSLVGVFGGVDLFGAGQRLILRLWEGLRSIWTQMQAWFQARLDGVLGLLPGALKRQLGLADGAAPAPDTAVLPTAAAVAPPIMPAAPVLPAAAAFGPQTVPVPPPAALASQPPAASMGDLVLNVTVNASGAAATDATAIATQATDALERLMPEILARLRREMQDSQRLAFSPS
ncbi:MAG: phage tail tape measure protein [Alphaproteobacteria bacterium]|nr:MAG: phage tail tape measure protein [Alphaproteobacteria bacterium]